LNDYQFNINFSINKIKWRFLMFTIQNANVLYGDNLDPVKANLLVEDQEIVEISPRISKGKIIDSKGCIVAPGLINSHIHLGDSVFMDCGDGKSIDEIVKPPDGIKHRKLSTTSPSRLIEYMRISMWNMLYTGTTTFVDFREGGKEGIELINKAADNVPISKIILGRHESFLKPGPDPNTIISDLEELLDICEGIAPSGLGEITDKTAKIITDTTGRLNKLSALHVAEYEQVQENSIEESGKTEVQRAVEAGFKLLIHLTAPLRDDISLVSSNKIPVVCCPRSNGALSVGIPPIKEMIQAGIDILLGTDNLMFNSPNMFREMEYALKVTRGYYRDYFSPVEIIKMATVNAGKALQLNTGSICEGKSADIIITEQISSNPHLSLINRTEPGNIKCVIREGDVVFNQL
jgi:cytosine/adenosine deaminase-related metal-dependent hydrolase